VHEVTPEDDELIALASGLHETYEAHMDKLAYQNALADIFKVTSRANKYIDETTPWILAKEEANHARLAAILYNLLESIRICTILLTPVMPESCKTILTQIGATDEISTYDSATSFGALPKTVKTNKGEIIFPRFDVAKELKALQS
jgi:methionyl-tRNA synthetase